MTKTIEQLREILFTQLASNPSIKEDFEKYGDFDEESTNEEMNEALLEYIKDGGGEGHLSTALDYGSWLDGTDFKHISSGNHGDGNHRWSTLEYIPTGQYLGWSGWYSSWGDSGWDTSSDEPELMEQKVKVYYA